VWSENGSEIASIGKHGVRPDEVEEAIMGVDGEEPKRVDVRTGTFYGFLGQTGDGRLLSMVGELLPGNAVRVFHAIDMTPSEKARFRKARQ
jgi:hypothetical protein